MGRTAGTEAGIRGLHGMSPHCPYVPWGLRDGTDSWDRGLQMGLHGMSPHCPYVPWGLRDGTDSWDRGLQRGLRGMSPHCPHVPWGLRDGTDSWDRGLQRGLHGIVMYILLFLVPCHGTHGSPKFPLDSRWQYWTIVERIVEGFFWMLHFINT